MKLKRRERGGAVSWRAHFVDPDTRKEVAVTLDPLACGSHEARRRWAIVKARELASRRMDRAAGIMPAEPPAGAGIEAAIATYLDGPGALLKPKTLEGHGLALRHLRVWARRERVTETSQITRAKLVTLREYLISVPKSKPHPGGRKVTSEKRSAVTINRELRSLKAILNDWRKRQILPELHKDDIGDALKALSTAREDPTYLGAAELRKLVEAALRHDAETFVETRREHAGEGQRGTTPRYEPIAPFLVTLLLTGLRRGEALALRWAALDLGALDHEGREVGEIRVSAEVAKTDRARTIGLEVSPALRRVLVALRPRDGRGHVFGGREPYTVDLVEKARRRLVASYGAPAFTWQALRSTCATYLTCSTGIYGSATVYMSAKQLGHSIPVAEKHYLGVHRGIPRDAKTLEAAMQIEPQLDAVLAAIEPAHGLRVVS